MSVVPTVFLSSHAIKSFELLHAEESRRTRHMTITDTTTPSLSRLHHASPPFSYVSATPHDTPPISSTMFHHESCVALGMNRSTFQRLGIAAYYSWRFVFCSRMSRGVPMSGQRVSSHQEEETGSSGGSARRRLKRSSVASDARNLRLA